MASPSRRLSDVPHLSNAGPNRSVLQELLEEINGEAPHVIRRVTGSMEARGSLRPRRDLLTRSTSVWVPTSAIAQDARDKLRALDEARDRRRSAHGTNDPKDNPVPPPFRRQSTHGIPQGIWQPRSTSPPFGSVDFTSSDASSQASRTPSPGSIPRSSEGTSRMWQDALLLGHC